MSNLMQFSSRRTFLATSATVLAATQLPQLATANEDSNWIDAHVHVWTPDTKKYPLSNKFKVQDMQPSSFTPEELFVHTRPAGVERIVLIQMSFYGYDNSYMLDMIARHVGVFSGVGIVDHRASDLAEKVRELSSGGVRGFRIHSTAENAASAWPADSGMQRLWSLAHELNLAICPLINPADIKYVEKLCEKFPDTKVVIDHFARIGISGAIEAQPLAELCKLARFKNVHVKTSAFYALGKKAAPYDDLGPMIRQVRDAYGSQRLMWASDCPYQVQGKHDYASSIALIKDRLDFLTEDDKQWMLQGTAQKVYWS
jgi:predicted TIM-barrel fold metal-dependent hydrolase